MLVPSYTIARRSPNDACGSVWGVIDLCTGSDSPVSAASSTFSWATSNKRRSVGTTVPASSSTMSPGTSSGGGTVCSAPFRRTRAVAVAIAPRAVMALSARYSCTKPRVALSATIARMAMMSSGLPTTTVTAAAASSTRTMTSVNCASSMRRGPRLVAATSALSPYSARRRATSVKLRPFCTLLCSVMMVASVVSVCQGADAVADGDAGASWADGRDTGRAFVRCEGNGP